MTGDPEQRLAYAEVIVSLCEARLCISTARKELAILASFQPFPATASAMMLIQQQFKLAFEVIDILQSELDVFDANYDANRP